jgi:hypothetical protein
LYYFLNFQKEYHLLPLQKEYRHPLHLEAKGVIKSESQAQIAACTGFFQ